MMLIVFFPWCIRAAYEQRLLIGPSAQSAENFAMDMDQNHIAEAVAALEKFQWLQKARDKLCQPGLMTDDLFWRNYFFLREADITPDSLQELSGDDMFWVDQLQQLANGPTLAGFKKARPEPVQLHLECILLPAITASKLPGRTLEVGDGSFDSFVATVRELHQVGQQSALCSARHFPLCLSFSNHNQAQLSFLSLP